MKPILAIVHFTRAAIDPIQAVFGSRLSGIKVRAERGPAGADELVLNGPAM